MNDNFIAHIKKNPDGLWANPHLLSEHLNSVARIAGEFASEFGNKDWAEFAGYLHDLGKYNPDWQKYIRRKTGYYDENAHIENNRGRPNHSTAGAVLPFVKFNNSPAAKLLAYVIGGHHSGLPDWIGQLDNRIYDKDGELNTADLDKISPIKEATEFISKNIPTSTPSIIKNQKNDSKEQLHMWIRMLFSCLVDADFLDTEKYMSDAMRGGYNSIEQLKTKFDNYIQTKKSDAELNKKRNAILNQCIQKSKLQPGFFSLTVPTGGGKTLSSMAFALNHALHHNKKRIIVAIPYTSIIEQTAKVFKYGSDIDEEIELRKNKGNFLFGEDQVVEHHSNIDPDSETSKNRLASENWDAPIIVTTNVQLFESLFANKTSTCRKLHNIVNSIIILDEAQMLPPEYLKPILSALKGLVKYFGVTVLFMSATQPALKGTIGTEPVSFTGIEDVTEIIDDPEELAKDFKRVNIHFPENLNNKSDWEDIAEQLEEYNQVLCIVNTKNDCRKLHSLMPEDTYHLSTFMCGEERSEKISEIKNKLKNGETIRVISTQLVEAGVDIDFPVVYRALSGLDSIAQAAGRCNRENKLPEGGKVVVFVPPTQSPSGHLQKAEGACKAIIRNKNYQEFTPNLYTEYFKYFYSNLNTFDKADFEARLVKNANDFTFAFKEFAEKFYLIDSHKQQSIIVWYENTKTGRSSLPLIEQLKFAGSSRDLIRKLQRYTVNVYENIFNKIKANNLIQLVNGYWVQSDPILYKPGLGLLANDDDWIYGDGIV